MTRSPIDAYLVEFTGVQRESLDNLLEILRAELPGAEEVISYGLPCFKVEGRAIAGFGGFANHNSYFPHSGAVLDHVDRLPKWCGVSKGTLRFSLDRHLSRALVRRLVKARLADIALRGR